MNWGIFTIAVIISGCIILAEQSILKKSPRKDKTVFFTFLFVGVILSLFDLPYIIGPVTAIEAFFSPLGNFMSK